MILYLINLFNMVSRENQLLFHYSTTKSQEAKCVDLKFIAVNKPQ